MPHETFHFARYLTASVVSTTAEEEEELATLVDCL